MFTTGRFEQAARVFGAVDVLADQIGNPAVKEVHAQKLNALENRLGQEWLQTQLDLGRAMPLARVVRYIRDQAAAAASQTRG